MCPLWRQALAPVTRRPEFRFASSCMRRSWPYILVAVVLAAGAGVFVYIHQKSTTREVATPPKPEAPPDLEKLRSAYDAGLDAIHRGDGPAAIKQFSAFTFGKRVVDEYRLFYLANGYQ